MSIDRQKAESLVNRLLENAAGVKYGSVEVVLKIHGGRIKDVVFSSTTSSREGQT